MRFHSPYGIVTLTDERKQHILAFHPDVVRALPYFETTLAEPEWLVRSVHDQRVVICYRFLARQKKYLAIVVKITKHPFILTAYLAKKLKQDIL
mgnify:CR=1 FL=1